jgi:hypothetical protein
VALPKKTQGHFFFAFNIPIFVFTLTRYQ